MNKVAWSRIGEKKERKEKSKISLVSGSVGCSVVCYSL